MTEHRPLLRRFLLASALVGATSCSADTTADDAATPPDVSLGSRETEGVEDDEPAAIDEVGLRSDTTYEFSAAADDGSAADTTLTTGALPAGAPAVGVTTDTGSTSEGITFFGVSSEAGAGAPATDAVFWGVDASGEVVWYYESGAAAASDPIVRATGDGELLVFVDDLIQHIRLDGTVLAEYDLSAIDSWHHDAMVLENGGVLALGRENRTVDGEDLRGDSIVELDADGEVVWEWSAFDHLDTSRFPGELSTSESRAGGVDWSHANSVYIDESTGEILVSLRSQDDPPASPPRPAMRASGESEWRDSGISRR